MKFKLFRGAPKIGIKVGDIMTRNFVSVKPDTPISECAKEMVKKHVGSLVVKDQQHLRGILTERDIVWAVVKKQNLNNIKAKDIMTQRVVSITPAKDLSEAIDRIRKTRFRILPVVVKGRAIGVITVKDILRIQPTLAESLRESIEIKEETEKIKRSKAALTGETSWIKEGECSECGAYGLLYNMDNRLLCESCRDMIE